MKVLVIGCGVSGLSCAVRLLEAGHAVTIWARELPPHTTSDIAAAIWYPYLAATDARVLGWAQRTYQVLVELSAVPGSGVSLVPGLELIRAPAALPSWSALVPDFRLARPDELPPGWTGCGYVYTLPLAETPIYLGRHLLGRLRRLGGTVIEREISSLEEALAACPVVVDCAGLGARILAGDDSLHPIRGHVVRVARPERGCDRLLFDDENPAGITYIIPRSTDVIVGGTAEPGAWSLVPEEAAGPAMLDRAAALLPALAGARLLDERVGLRPARPTVRVEAEPRPGGGLVVHDYGHGGAGITLSWGCAEEVVLLVEKHRP